ncbi:unnamed protein product [Paramecium sonneborni]|uniref:Uncharacterized protein n=1 Tax=Paramecium sonneborni TaxID=65129 RepID=A0A8S1KP23_9CILI|nr:unnamed protein product [Paramecium sonneborni]
MIHYRNLPTVYRNDMENYQIRRFEKASGFKISKKVQMGRRRTVRIQPQLLMTSQKFKFNKRGKSSESLGEGTLNNNAQLVMLSLPYFCTNHNKRQTIMNKWKQIIWGVRIILRYKKIFKEQAFFDQLKRLPKRRKLSSPISGFKSPKKRRLPVKSSDNYNFTMTTKELPQDTSRSKTSRKLRNQFSENFQKSIYYQNLKQQEQRLERLRTNSLYQLMSSQEKQSMISTRTQSVLIRKMRIKRQTIQ